MPNKLTSNPVNRLPSAMPPRIASMYRLTACPRKWAGAAVCTTVFVDVLVILIDNPLSISTTTMTQNHGTHATTMSVRPNAAANQELKPRRSRFASTPSNPSAPLRPAARSTAPTLLISTPANAGPAMREILNCVEFSASPAPIYPRSTMDGTIEENAGIDSASVTPTINDSEMIIHGRPAVPRPGSAATPVHSWRTNRGRPASMRRRC